MKGLQEESNRYIQELKQGANNILVAIRVRPINQKEISNTDVETVKVLEQNVIVLMDPEYDENDVATFLKKNRQSEQNYAFDVVFDQKADQKEIYEKTTFFLIDGVLDGYNATVFAYGATGAGKTYTMTGTQEKIGIIPRTLNDLFVAVMKQKNQKDIAIKVSYLEIYNETIKDLLTPDDKTLDLREDGKQGMVIAGISEVNVSATSEILSLIKIGNKNRAKEPTGANENSTRSHAVLQVHVEITAKGQGIEKQIQSSKLSLVDLAGSERAASTTNRGQRMIEGAKINQSLLVLGSCIQALCTNTEKNKNLFVPYRGSKLTRLLKDSLGGNCRTVMIANISPSVICFEDTYNTLSYANRAKNIKTISNRNVLNVQNHIQNYGQIIETLRQENEELKRQLQNLSSPPQAIQQQKPKSFPNINQQSQKEVTLYQSLEQQITQHYKEEKVVLRKMFETEDKIDQIQLELIKLENEHALAKDQNEKEKFAEKLDHEQKRQQTLEVDLNDYTLKYKDLVTKRKEMQSQINKSELRTTNGLLLSNLLKQNELTIQNLQYRQNEKRGDIQQLQKQLEIEFLQNQLKQKEYRGQSGERKVKPSKLINSNDKIFKEPLLPKLQKHKRHNSPNPKHDSNIETRGRNNSFREGNSPKHLSDEEYQDYSMQDYIIRENTPIQQRKQINKQVSLMSLDKKKNIGRNLKRPPSIVRRQYSPNIKEKREKSMINEELEKEEVKRLRLKRLNNQLKQNNFELN